MCYLMPYMLLYFPSLGHKQNLNQFVVLNNESIIEFMLLSILQVVEILNGL